MNATDEKPKVVTTEKACEMLGCSRTTFHQKYKKRLTQYTTANKHKNLFMLNEVEDLVKSKDEPQVLKNFELIT